MKLSLLNVRVLVATAVLGFGAQQAQAHILGVSADSKYSSAVAAQYHALGIKSVRLWFGIAKWGSPYMAAGSIQAAKDYKAAGFDVMMSVVPDGGIGMPSAAQVKSTFDIIADDAALLKAVDRWEIGNEPDRSEYWPGGLSSYVTTFLAPAYGVLHAKGEKVVSGGPSWNPDSIKTMVAAGMLKYCDYVGYHPYRNSASAIATAIGLVKSYVGGKPIIASEWTVRGYVEKSDPNDKNSDYKYVDSKSKSEWAAENGKAFKDTLKGIYASYYFATFVKPSAMAGLGSLMYPTSLKPNEPFYGMQKGFANVIGNSTDDGDDEQTPPPVVSQPTKQSEVTISVVNSDTDKDVVGFSNASGTMTLDIEKIRVANFGLVAESSDKIESVKFVINGKTVIESNAPYSVYGDSPTAGITGIPAKVGTYKLTATPYSGNSATGTAGKTKSLTLIIKDSK